MSNIGVDEIHLFFYLQVNKNNKDTEQKILMNKSKQQGSKKSAAHEICLIINEVG